MAMMGVSPALMNQATQALLNKSVDLAYLLRGGYRVQVAIPDEKSPVIFTEILH